jgi:hypothetical protein
MKRLFVLAWMFLSLAATAQTPVVMCPVHNVPAQITGQTRKDGEGRTIAWEYCHGSGSDRHCFWGHD